MNFKIIISYTTKLSHLNIWNKSVLVKPLFMPKVQIHPTTWTHLWTTIFDGNSSESCQTLYLEMWTVLWWDWRWRNNDLCPFWCDCRFEREIKWITPAAVSSSSVTSWEPPGSPQEIKPSKCIRVLRRKFNETAVLIKRNNGWDWMQLLWKEMGRGV